ncbi:MAG: uroporphyrinogen-III synthase [Granulosicoccus sp.]|nr:uroporphyrinogen-III synthase [Granulosicoccus sp.]
MPTHNATLAGVSVLITRPGDAGQELADRIRDLGGQPIIIPVIDIVYLAESDAMTSAVKAMDRTDLAVFVSRHAAISYVKTLESLDLKIPVTLKIAAIGQSTAKILQTAGIAADFVPDNESNSESLLALLNPILKTGDRVQLFRGQSGRELLATEIIQHGALLAQIEAYHRIPSSRNFEPEISRVLAAKKLVTVITSGEILTRLRALFAENTGIQLQSSPLVVLSKRISEIASANDFTGPITVAGEASNAGLTAAVLEATGRNIYST